MTSVHSLYATTQKIMLLPVRWETDTYPLMGERPQGHINAQIVDDCDLLIGIFWTRLGTPTGKADSGTVEEIERHVAKKFPAMIYFSNVPVAMKSVDEKQYDGVRKLKDDLKSRSLYKEFETPQEFERQFQIHLYRVIMDNHHFKHVPHETHAPTPRLESNPSEVDNLSDTAKTVLVYGARDRGEITVIEFLGGLLLIQTPSKSLFYGAVDQEVTKWKAAIKDLKKKKLIELVHTEESADTYEVTNRGQELADHLTKENPAE